MGRIVNNHGPKANKDRRRALVEPFHQVLEGGHVEMFLDGLLYNLFVGKRTDNTDLFGPALYVDTEKINAMVCDK